MSLSSRYVQTMPVTQRVQFSKDLDDFRVFYNRGGTIIVWILENYCQLFQTQAAPDQTKSTGSTCPSLIKPLEAQGGWICISNMVF